ncbi:MAG: NB-ARC domain-containing protein [Bacteroidota bacterium]
MHNLSHSKNFIFQSQVYAQGNLHIGDIYHIQGEPKEIPLQLTPLPHITKANVIGRDTDLDKVKTILQTSDLVVLMNGIGGIGKTTLAKYFIAQFKQEYNYIAWVNNTANIKEAFTNDIALIDSLHLRAELESLPKNDQWVDQAFRLILNRMRQLGGNQSTQKNLLIIDNAGEDIEHTQTLDQIALRPNWKVLVTSREKLLGFTEYELGFLSADAAQQLFYLYYRRERADTLVEEILEILDYHTLLIEVVSKTAQSLRWDLAELLTHLKKKGLHISESAKIKFPHNYNQKVWNVFEYLLEMFSLANLSDYEQWVLMQFAVLPSIPIAYEGQNGENILDFLQIEKGAAKDKFTTATNRVVEKGWLFWDKLGDRFRMHQLLQEVLQFKLRPTIEDCKTIITTIASNLRHGNDIVKYENNAYLGTHLTNYFFCKYEDNELNLTKTGELFSKYTDYCEHHIVGLCMELVYTYTTLNRPKLGITEIERGTYWARQLPHSHLKMIMFNNQLSMLYRDLKDTSGREAYLSKAEKAVCQSINMLYYISDGFPDKDFFYAQQAAHYNNLGLIYEEMDRLDDAIKTMRKARNLLYKCKKRAPLLVGSFHNNLASAYLRQGRVKLAFNNAKKAVNYLIKLMSIARDHHDVKINLENTYRLLAYILIVDNNHEKAIINIEKSLDLLEDIYPDNHPLKVHPLNEIANFYFLMQKHEIALDFIQKSLVIIKANPNEKNHHFNITENLREAILVDMKEKGVSI